MFLTLIKRNDICYISILSVLIASNQGYTNDLTKGKKLLNDVPSLHQKCLTIMIIGGVIGDSHIIQD